MSEKIEDKPGVEGVCEVGYVHFGWIEMITMMTMISSARWIRVRIPTFVLDGVGLFIAMYSNR